MNTVIELGQELAAAIAVRKLLASRVNTLEALLDARLPREALSESVTTLTREDLKRVFWAVDKANEIQAAMERGESLKPALSEWSDSLNSWFPESKPKEQEEKETEE